MNARPGPTFGQPIGRESRQFEYRLIFKIFILTIKFSSHILSTSHEGQVLFTKGEAIVAFLFGNQKIGY
jgi:hypothetical protein